MNTLTFHQDWAIFITYTKRSCINSIDTVRKKGGGVSCIYFLLYRVKKLFNVDNNLWIFFEY
ncbi:MAG: hypothetical protein MUO21_08555 [Nitrososphaeraceae archaeon]|nr:hypothetical protein [Nitrososphaeraceae archaeon]